MKLMMRRIRGALGMAVTWTVAWVALSGIVQALTPTEQGRFQSLNAFMWNATAWALWGAIGGLVFGMCLASDGRSSIRRLSVRRAAFWGIASAIACPAAFEIGGRVLLHEPLFWLHARVLAEWGLAGMLSGGGLVALARRSARQEPDFLDEEHRVLELPAADFAPSVERQSARTVA